MLRRAVESVGVRVATSKYQAELRNSLCVPEQPEDQDDDDDDDDTQKVSAIKHVVVALQSFPFLISLHDR